MSQAITAHVENLPRPETVREIDRSGWNGDGQFLPAYNERFRKGPDDPIGPGFASVAEKRLVMDVDRFEIAGASQEVIDRDAVIFVDGTTKPIWTRLFS